MIITLTNGSQVDTANITFDPSTYRFTYGDNDITNLIRATDKNNNWPEYDPKTSALFAYNSQQLSANAPQNQVDPFDTSGSGTSTVGNFWDQITTDPLSAPLSAADNAIGTVTKNSLKSIFGSLTGWIIIGAVGVYLYFEFRRR